MAPLSTALRGYTQESARCAGSRDSEWLLIEQRWALLFNQKRKAKSLASPPPPCYRRRRAPPYIVCLLLFRGRHAIKGNTVKYLAEIRFVTTIFINIYGLEEQLKNGGGFILQQVRGRNKVTSVLTAWCLI